MTLSMARPYDLRLAWCPHNNLDFCSQKVTGLTGIALPIKEQECQWQEGRTKGHPEVEADKRSSSKNLAAGSKERNPEFVSIEDIRVFTE